MNVFQNHRSQKQGGIVTIILMCITLAFAGNATAMDQASSQNSWKIIKMSGEAWVASDKPEPVSLNKGMHVKNGDKLRTGRNGRILLKRGEETIMVSPNSAIALPAKHPGEGKTQILQQAGNILLEVEKRNVKHFEVSTPYLVAVVKGTRFSVQVDGNGANVAVERGKVEVMDFKSGKIALVKPGQTARLAKDDPNGLQLEGTGVKENIRQGTPQQPVVEPLPLNVNRAMQRANKASTKKSPIKKQVKKTTGAKKMRIGRALGQVKLNVATSTKGLIRKSDSDDLNAASFNNETLAVSNGGNINGGLGNTGETVNNNVGGGGVSLGLNSGDGSVGLGLDLGGTSVGVGANLPPGLGGISPDLGIKLGF